MVTEQPSVSKSITSSNYSPESTEHCRKRTVEKLGMDLRSFLISPDAKIWLQKDYNQWQEIFSTYKIS